MDDRGPIVFDPADPADPASEERVLHEAEADVAAGRTVPRADVVRWLRLREAASRRDLFP